MRWIKKQIEVEAMVFTGETKQDVYNWVKEFQFNITPSFDKDKNPILIVPTLEGDMICAIGDYMIKEPFPTDWRKFYPCKPDIFQKTYQPVESITDGVNEDELWEEAIKIIFVDALDEKESLPELKSKFHITKK